MKKLRSMSDLPAFAIAGESKAAELYTKMAPGTSASTSVCFEWYLK